MVLIDSNIILDLWDQDRVWAPWSEKQLSLLALTDELVINPIVYAEISSRYSTQSRLDQAISELDLTFAQLPREAAFLASNSLSCHKQPFPFQMAFSVPFSPFDLKQLFLPQVAPPATNSSRPK